MPLPNPNQYGDKDRFVSACISAAMKEGYKQEQAIAICLDKWRNRN